MSTGIEELVGWFQTQPKSMVVGQCCETTQIVLKSIGCVANSREFHSIAYYQLLQTGCGRQSL
jgi:hypothetical protein